jgi:hypothetical protein
MLISTDADTKISIDGDDSGTLGANQTKRFPVAPGSHILIAMSTEQSTLTQRKVVDVRRDEQQAVLVEFAKDLEQARRQAAAGGGRRRRRKRRRCVGSWRGRGFKLRNTTLFLATVQGVITAKKIVPLRSLRSATASACSGTRQE